MIVKDEDVCIHCGACDMPVDNVDELVEVCPVGAIKIKED